MIVYSGPSRFDNAPIVAIVTGIRKPSENPKTGPMAQLWILRSDVSPLDAIASGSDYSVCGNCSLRGMVTADGKAKRACYVAVKNAPLTVWKKYRRSSYPIVSPATANASLRAAGRSIRLGAYGEPVALPIDVLRELCNGLRHTGYTHQWLTSPEYRPYLMASVDTAADYGRARSLDWRTFRTRDASEALAPGEIQCPASDESGKRTTCDRCNLCNGSRDNDRRRSIAIVTHGANKVHFMTFRRDAVALPAAATRSARPFLYRNFGG